MDIPKSQRVYFVGLKVMAEDSDAALITADLILVRAYEQKGELFELLEAFDSASLVDASFKVKGLQTEQSTAT